MQFVLQRDKKGLFLFASLQGTAGQALLLSTNKPTEKFDSFILADQGKIYTRSSAALKVLRQLGGAWSWIASIAWLVPKPLRDTIYSWVARNRYKWFGQKDTCWLPSPEWKDRFLN